MVYSRAVSLRATLLSYSQHEFYILHQFSVEDGIYLLTSIIFSNINTGLSQFLT